MAHSTAGRRRLGARTRSGSLLAAAVAAALLSACGGVEVRDGGDDASDGEGDGSAESASGPLELAVVPKAVGHEFWNTVRAGAECAAEQAGDVTVEWDGVTAETDVEGQVNLIQNFVTRQVDGIVYAATDSAALAPATDQAVGAGIPVAMIDSGTDPQPDDVPLYATDNHAAAVEAANLLAGELGEGEHDVALIEFQPGSQTNSERVEGFSEGLARHDNLNLVGQQPSHSDVNEARRVTEDILTANPDLAGIFAANEPSVLGAAQAVEAAGRSGEIVIIGWDAAPDEIAGLRDGQISALVVQNPFRMGYLGVENMVAHLRDGTPLTSADTGVTFLTRENIDSDEARAVLEPSCDNPPVE
ncbi:ABC transporter substrate-binding protein [Streptomyces radicis]|uniref:LacI family transcriptional regulator n=1 Tax=Streptomyces radicis TaxID=1750517 RepID=A0A3A9VYF1_9ACTN|nr:ABC transporter substrate-binding protein [Streptomyces radicis]RKN05988.1 LacI family transcriptional regulator [Streptomyces radicis]RKN17705.1 LacI family transcriptional regulator [Streptomyces radicis]